MHSTFALAAFAAVAIAAPAPQAPPTAAPAGCAPSYSGRFQIAAVNITTTGKRSIEARQSSCDGPGALTLTLNNGQLVDSAGRIGSIVANRQFQFDGPPPQAGAIYTSGWSSCSNGSLAIGGNTRFYQCLSGTFYNLYDQMVGAQCNPVTLQIQGCSAGGAAGGGGQVGAKPDGQPTGTGQGAPPATQIGDGQIQAPTGKPPVSQIGDGQIQAPTGKAPVTQIGDGQIQAPTGTPKPPVTQIGDGQIQAPTAKPPVTQIGDGQIQAPTAKPPVITQIGDGQIQAPTSTAVKPPVVTQIGDGQIQSPTTNTTQPIQFTGAASVLSFSSVVAAAALGLASMILL
jgi:hypothetical protein